MISKNTIATIATLIGIIYLFMSLNPFIMWIIWPGFINFPLFFSIIIITLILIKINLVEFNTRKLLIAFPIALFMIHIGTGLLGGAEFNVGKLMSFISLICVLSFKSFIHLKIFVGFRKLMLFLSWFAIAIFFINLVGIDLPYYRINAFTLVMQNSFGGESFYKLYGLVVSSTNTIYNIGGLNVARICGPFQEPGHFAIYLGIIMLFEKMIYNKLSKGFIIAGILTFSPNFFLILLIIFLYDLLYSENKKSILLYLVGGGIFFSFLLILSEEVRDQLYFLTIGRNLENSSTDVVAVLDDRAGKQALAYYNRFIESHYFYYGRGVEYMSKYGVLSDWRGMVLKFGLLGFIFSLFACLRIILFPKKKGLILILALLIAIIYLQRSWMFESPFAYIFLIIGLISFEYVKKFNINPNDVKL